METIFHQDPNAARRDSIMKKVFVVIGITAAIGAAYGGYHLLAPLLH
ncbi:MAG TPA: hypothetical protein VMT99_01290 [Candidatus Paceibacterota bacterium]|nr:hypothetical protein [Candidatus Paceibacterota bacterium]